MISKIPAINCIATTPNSKTRLFLFNHYFSTVHSRLGWVIGSSPLEPLWIACERLLQAGCTSCHSTNQCQSYEMIWWVTGLIYRQDESYSCASNEQIQQHTKFLLDCIQYNRAATAANHAWCSGTHQHMVFPYWLTAIITSSTQINATL